MQIRHQAVADAKAAPRSVVLPGLLNADEIQHVCAVRAAHEATHEWQEAPLLPLVKYDDGHEILYLHSSVQEPPVAQALHTCTTAMRTQPLGGEDASSLNVRCSELHTYGIGSGLSVARHNDSGSTLTMSVLLSNEALVGGMFMTWEESRLGVWGLPVEHPLAPGDAILFYSEDFHNVSPILAGARKSLVIELWTGAVNKVDREQ